MKELPARPSSLRPLIYLVIITIGALLLLQYTGTANVLSKSEKEEIIDRPHQ